MSGRDVRVTLGLALVYVLTLASTDPVDLATGLLLGGLLVAGLRHRLRDASSAGDRPTMAGRLAAFPRFAAALLRDVVAGTWDVALRVVGIRDLDHPGIVRVPIGARSDRGVAVSSLASTLSPGSYLVDIDWERRELLIHVIDAADADAVREHMNRFYERYQRAAFP